ncbi:MAG: hypothetical protein AW09_000669 [Candidatus Accumulibacter phosphatis]|uniref:Uncharacterized protein n=1 Tax=Candidatus Accumulibacter phosphatis TaxID=327160 RepID=A0A080LYU8_9PROT|nr:MAG: hypothetical protein AW09_000669 [Candidatus Accumulibacter phosphatis]
MGPSLRSLAACVYSFVPLSDLRVSSILSPAQTGRPFRPPVSALSPQSFYSSPFPHFIPPDYTPLHIGIARPIEKSKFMGFIG